MPRPSGMCTRPARRISWGLAFVMSSTGERDACRRTTARAPTPRGRACSCPRRSRRAPRRPTLRHVDAHVEQRLHRRRTARRDSATESSASLMRRVLGVVVGRCALDGFVVAQVRGAHGGVVADLVGGAVRDADAEVEHRDRARQAEHHGDVVLDEQQRDLLLVDDGAQRARRAARSRARRVPTTARRAARSTGRWRGRVPPRPAGRSRAAATDAPVSATLRRSSRSIRWSTRSRSASDGRCSEPAVRRSLQSRRRWLRTR